MSKSEKIIGDIVNLFHNDYIDTPEFNKVIDKYKKKEKISTSLWHKQHEKILKNIAENSDWYNELHKYTSERYNKLGNLIYAPLILSTLSVGLFTLIANNYDKVIDSKLLVVITGSCNLCSGTITGILKKWNLSKWITSHDVYADKFLYISQDIKYQLSLPCDNREKMPIYLHRIATEYHEARLTSPKIPSKYIKSFKDKKMIKMTTKKMNTPFELSGLKPITIYKCNPNDCIDDSILDIIKKDKPPVNKPPNKKPNYNKPNDNSSDDNSSDDNSSDDNSPDDNSPDEVIISVNHDNSSNDNLPNNNSSNDNLPNDNSSDEVIIPINNDADDPDL